MIRVSPLANNFGLLLRRFGVRTARWKCIYTHERLHGANHPGLKKCSCQLQLQPAHPLHDETYAGWLDPPPLHRQLKQCQYLHLLQQLSKCSNGQTTVQRGCFTHCSLARRGHAVIPPPPCFTMVPCAGQVYRASARAQCHLTFVYPPRARWCRHPKLAGLKLLPVLVGDEFLWLGYGAACTEPHLRIYKYKHTCGRTPNYPCDSTPLSVDRYVY